MDSTLLSRDQKAVAVPIGSNSLKSQWRLLVVLQADGTAGTQKGKARAFWFVQIPVRGSSPLSMLQTISKHKLVEAENRRAL